MEISFSYKQQNKGNGSETKTCEERCPLFVPPKSLTAPKEGKNSVHFRLEIYTRHKVSKFREEMKTLIEIMLKKSVGVLLNVGFDNSQQDETER